MSYTNTHELALLNAQLGATATLLGSTVDIALSTADPLEDGSGLAEPSGNGYVRVTVNNDGAQWGAASLIIAVATKSNLLAVVFPQADGGPWGLISHWALFDAGTLKIKGAIDDGFGTPAPRQVNDTDIFRFLVGQLRVTQD